MRKSLLVRNVPNETCYSDSNWYCLIVYIIIDPIDLQQDWGDQMVAEDAIALADGNLADISG